MPKVLGLFNGVKTSKHLSKSETGFLRRVEHQSVPLALDVVILRLLSDVQAIKLQLSGQLFLSLKDNQGDLKGTEGREISALETYKPTHRNRDGFSWSIRQYKP